MICWIKDYITEHRPPLHLNRIWIKSQKRNNWGIAHSFGSQWMIFGIGMLHFSRFTVAWRFNATSKLMLQSSNTLVISPNILTKLLNLLCTFLSTVACHHFGYGSEASGIRQKKRYGCTKNGAWTGANTLSESTWELLFCVYTLAEYVFINNAQLCSQMADTPLSRFPEQQPVNCVCVMMSMRYFASACVSVHLKCYIYIIWVWCKYSQRRSNRRALDGNFRSTQNIYRPIRIL